MSDVDLKSQYLEAEGEKNTQTGRHTQNKTQLIPQGNSFCFCGFHGIHRSLLPLLAPIDTVGHWLLGAAVSGRNFNLLHSILSLAHTSVNAHVE